jgi:hypothetical protein
MQDPAFSAGVAAKGEPELGRGKASTLGFLMLGLLAARGQNQATTLTTTSSIAPLAGFSLSDSGCSYEGMATISSENGAIKLSNRSGTEAHFDFFKLNQGHNYLELVAHIEKEERRRVAGEAELGYPTFASIRSSTTVPAQGSVTLPIPNSAGTYGMVCIPWNLGPLRKYSAGPLTIS